MATLDRVIEMQGQGLPDAEIVTRLQNEGVSPQEINDSLNQARVKSAVSSPDAMTMNGQSPTPVSADQQSMPGGSPGMQPFIMQGSQMPQTQEMAPPQGAPPQPSSPEMYPADQGYPGPEVTGCRTS